MISRRAASLGLIGVSAAMTTPAHGEGQPVIPTNYADLVTMARAHVDALTAGHTSWGFGRSEHWNVDLDSGEIWWTLPDNVIARAPVQLIGSWASDLGSFRWAWNHPVVPPGGAPAAQAVKDFADAHGITELQPVEVECASERAREFACVAVLLADLQGLYVGQASRTALAYLGFGPVTLSRAD